MLNIAGYLGNSPLSSDIYQNVALDHNSHFAYRSGNHQKVETSDGLIICTGRLYYRLKSGDAGLSELLYDTVTNRKDFDEVLKECSGHFSLILLDKARSTLHLATDKIGTQHLYYSQKGDGFYFASTLQDLLNLLPGKKAISPQGVFQYVFFHCIPAPDTIYENCYKLKSAELLSISPKKRNQYTYFIPDFEASSEPKQNLRKTLLNALENSVNRSLESADLAKTGAFLSGGLDSSTVAGFFAKKAGPGKAKTFTIGFNAEGYDESGYAKISADHFNTEHYVYYVTPEDVEDALTEIADFYDEPFGNSSALPAYYCAKFAREQGISHLLAGDGGDELFAGNARYSKQKVFELYYKIPSPLRKLLLEKPLSLIPENTSIPVISKIASYVKQAKVSLPDRLQTYNFLRRFDPSEVFSNDLLDRIDVDRPSKLECNRYSEPEKAGTLNKMLYLDWKFTLSDNDLVKVSSMCHLAGIDVSYPMLDDELLELSTTIPEDLLLPGQDLRKFYKDACKNFLSEKTLNKSKKGFGLPFGVWIRENKRLQDLAYQNVRSLKNTGFFKDSFLEHAIKMHSSDHPGYYGELIWILMMLNLWLDSHQPDS